MSVSRRRGLDLFGASSTATASASKKSVRAAEQDRPDVAAARAAWVDDQAKLDPERLVFIDETGTSTNMARLRGRAPRGERLVGKIPQGHWKTTTFVRDRTHRTLRHRWSDEWQRIPGLCRAGARAKPQAGRHCRAG